MLTGAAIVGVRLYLVTRKLSNTEIPQPVFVEAPIIAAARDGRTEDVNRLILDGADLHATDVHRQSPLDLAAEHGYVDIVAALLDAGVDVNDARNGGGWTALHAASTHDDLALAELLISRNADPNQKGLTGTPIDTAAGACAIRVLKLLLRHGASINVHDDGGRTPLHSAAHARCLEGLSTLIKAGAEIDARDGSRQTPLRRAVEAGWIDGVRYLLDHNADIDAVDDDNVTPIYWAVTASNLNMVRLLVERGANVDIRDADGRSLVDIAMHVGSAEIQRLVTRH